MFEESDERVRRRDERLKQQARAELKEEVIGLINRKISKREQTFRGFTFVAKKSDSKLE